MPAWTELLQTAAVFAYLLLGLAAYTAAPFLAQRWAAQPFLGAFLEQTMVFNGITPENNPDGWSAYRMGLRLEGMPAQREFFQLIAVDGMPVRSAADLSAALAGRVPGDSVELAVRVQGGPQTQVQVVLSALAPADRTRLFTIPYLIGLAYLLAGWIVFATCRQHLSGRLFALLAVSIALGLGLLFDLYTTHVFSALWTLALAMSGASLLSLALAFPHEDALAGRFRWLIPLVMLSAALLAANALLYLRDVERPTAYMAAWNAIYGFTGLMLLCTAALLIRRGGVNWPAGSQYLAVSGYAGLASFAPIGAYLLAASLGANWTFTPYLLFPLAVFPVVVSFLLLRGRRISPLAFSRGLRYGAMSVLIAAGYACIAAGLGLVVGQWLSPGSPLLTGFLFFLLATMLLPLRERTQHAVDALFFRGQRAYQERLQAFSDELTRVVDLTGILSIIRRDIGEPLAPSRLHIYLYDPLSDQYTAAPDETGRPTSDLRFPVSSGLAARLSEQRDPLVIDPRGALPAALAADRERLALLDAQVFAPLPGRQRLTGWLALGARSTGETYGPAQMGFLDALSDQAAVAVERAQVIANMENRVREMNVLTRVAQGINITLSLDDILELIFAQTVQILPSQHFHIMLLTRDPDTFRYAFYLENDERVAERENRPVALGTALEQEIIRQRKAIRTEDYARECQRRGFAAQCEQLYGWMGVPLNAGAETIGALSLASSDPAVEYSAEQQALLQAIADQVAGALTKARLLAESERRARQLSTLNEVTRQLTSTLEVEPLLRQILQSAVEILPCEAGALLLADAESGSLVFKAGTGVLAGLAADTTVDVWSGPTADAAQRGQAQIVNAPVEDWFSALETGERLEARTLLVIPLSIQDRVTGLVEVMNKQGGAFFSPGDVELLSAFAAQAAVAIENARLYTSTDMALAARVEELSVMQRIDRELNTSLDTSRAMRITLEWAMRQSGADAGLVGVVEGEDHAAVRPAASQGYADGQAASANEPLPVVDYRLGAVIEGGMPVRRLTGGADGLKSLLEGARSQAIIPIRRETITIGLILLESRSDIPLPDDTMAFLVRLSDHASIAISNAQLYAAVQQANLAKSDFVSFVAHELKNPMTSVKGYTELIAAGAVGPITDVQANFLMTIRHNIERMNTLVSDLNDSSKIEVGRLRLDFKPTRLADMIEQVTRSTRKQIEEKQQALTISIPEDLPPMWADHNRVEQVLVNLISNAHKYTQEAGQIEVCAEACANEWDPAGATRVVHVWVKDNGIGISEEDQKKIFQKFFRSEDPKTREAPGTGLGLNITRSLVEMQGGRIWFESEFRRGTTFHITIPVSES